MYMKTEFQNSIARLSFLFHITDIKSAWINPWAVPQNPPAALQTAKFIWFDLASLSLSFRVIFINHSHTWLKNYQKAIKKQTDFAWNFLTPETSVQQVPEPAIWKSMPISQTPGQDQQNGKQCWLPPRPSWLTSSMHPLIFS